MLITFDERMDERAFGQSDYYMQVVADLCWWDCKYEELNVARVFTERKTKKIQIIFSVTSYNFLKILLTARP